MSIWTTAEGEEIPFRDLTDSHLINIIKFLEKKAPGAYDRLVERLHERVVNARMMVRTTGGQFFRNQLQREKQRLSHVLKQDKRNPQPYNGASPYRELVKLAIKRNLLPEGYTWRTPLEEQHQDMQNMLHMASMPHVYGQSVSDAVRKSLIRQAETQVHPSLAVNVIDGEIKVVGAMEPNLKKMHTFDTEAMLNVRTSPSINEGDAIMFSGSSPWEGPAFITGIKHDHIYISHSRLEKLAPRSHTRKLRK